MAYPSDSGTTYTNKTDGVDIIRATDVNNLQTEVTAVKTLLGTIGSLVSGTFYYLMSEITGTDKAVGKTATQTLTNKTLTSPTLTNPVINVGSDATGDIYYRNSGGAFTRLPVGTNNQILRLSSGLPAWTAEASNANASTTVAGLTEIATSSEVTAGTATGGTGAPLVVTPDSLAASTPVFNGSGLTNVSRKVLFDVVTAGTQVNNTTSTVYTTTINANTFTASSAMKIYGSFKYSSSSTTSLSISYSFGGATIATFSTNTSSGSTDRYVKFETVVLFSNTSGLCDINTIIYDTLSTNNQTTMYGYASKATTLASLTSNQTFACSVTASSTMTATYYGTLVEKIS